MPLQASPGHPYKSESVFVTTNPVFKSRDGKYVEEEFMKKYFSPRRPVTGAAKRSPREDASSSQDSSPRSPRARTAPPGFKTMPPITYDKPLITLNFRQMTPWCRDMYRWFTPDHKQGVWYDNIEDVDRYRHLALRERLPARNIYHVEKGLIPNYSGFVPGQKFRYGKTWARETVNANRIGIKRPWNSTSLFENRPLGA